MSVSTSEDGSAIPSGLTAADFCAAASVTRRGVHVHDRRSAGASIGSRVIVPILPNPPPHRVRQAPAQ